MRQNVAFNCVIDDRHLGDRFSAIVNVTKKSAIEFAQQEGRIALAHIFVTPISDQLRHPHFPFETVRDAHNHFILYDITGRGRYIVRNRYDYTVSRRDCSIWDLGQAFALKVMEALRELI